MSRRSGRRERPPFKEDCDRCRLRFMNGGNTTAAGAPTGRDVNGITVRERMVLEQLWNDGEYDRMDRYLAGILERLPLCARCDGRKVIHENVLLTEARADLERLKGRIREQDTMIGDLDGEMAEQRDYEWENKKLRRQLEVHEHMAALLIDHDRGIRDWSEVMDAVRLLPDRLADCDYATAQ